MHQREINSHHHAHQCELEEKPAHRVKGDVQSFMVHYKAPLIARKVIGTMFNILTLV